LQKELAALEAFANAHHAVFLPVWDEHDATHKVPFVVIGPAANSPIS
jgi:hypothetical protein